MYVKDNHWKEIKDAYLELKGDKANCIMILEYLRKKTNISKHAEHCVFVNTINGVIDILKKD
jgi:hypothetical protein